MSFEDNMSDEMLKEMNDAIQDPWGQVVTNLEEMGLKVTCENESFFKMGFVAAYKIVSKELKKENDLLKSDLLFLCQPLNNQVSLDDLEECFKMLRGKWNLSESPNSSKEGV